MSDQHVRSAFAFPGDEVICPNGHAIALVTKQISVGDVMDLSSFQFVNGQVPVQYKPIDPCPQCGESFTRFGETGFKLHIKNKGWQP